MKKLLLMFLFTIAVHATYAQQKVRVNPSMMMMIQIPVNPSDPIWKDFKMPASQFHGAGSFIARADAPFYSKAELDELTAGLDRILNPDKFFEDQKTYDVFYMDFLKRWNVNAAAIRANEEAPARK